MAAQGGWDAGTRTDPPDADARTRLLDSAYTLFSRHGIQAVGIDRIIAEAGVAKATLYRHFPSKNDLVLAFLELRGQRWTQGWLTVEIERRATTPPGRLLAPFDAFDEWFRRPDFESCSFLRVLLEVPDGTHPVHRAAVGHLNTIRTMIAAHAEQAGIARPVEIAGQLQMLMWGSIAIATGGDADAARSARDVAERVLENAPRAG